MGPVDLGLPIVRILAQDQEPLRISKSDWDALQVHERGRLWPRGSWRSIESSGKAIIYDHRTSRVYRPIVVTPADWQQSALWFWER